MEDEIRLKRAWKFHFLKRKIKSFVYYFALLILLTAVIYTALTFPAQLNRVKYFFTHLFKKETGQLYLPKIAETNLNLQSIKEQTPKSTSLSLADLEDNHILIPRINIVSPVIWNSPPDEKTVLKNLQSGVVHYKGTALPDERGNIFIAGHSSGAWWRPGSYKTVFSLLEKLQNNDEVALAYQNKVYVYKVTSKIVVKPTDVWVMAPTTEPVLTLMTCVPVGTDLRRLIVRATPLSVIDKQIIKKYVQEPSYELPTFMFP